MRRGVLSFVAIILAIPVLYGTVTGQVSLEAAALRIVVLAVGVSILDRYAGPLMESLLSLLGSASGAEQGPTRQSER